MARRKHMQHVIDEALSIYSTSEKLGLGVDVVEVEHMKKIMSRTPSFTKKMFSDAEVKYCEAKTEPAIHFAARFAAKEAVLKALNVGFSNGVGYRDVEVKTKKGGMPIAVLHNRAKERAEDLGVVDIPISISHTKTESICVAIAITKKSIDAKKKSKVAVDEITAQFKDLRSQLDSI